MKKKALGIRRGGNRKLEEGSSADDGRGLSSGLRDVRRLMKSLEVLTINIELMMRRITLLNKSDPILEKLNDGERDRDKKGQKVD